MSVYSDDPMEFRINIIYLLVLRKHLFSNPPIYKVGKTIQQDFDRFKKDKEYKKGVYILDYRVCVNCHTAETAILKLFNQKYRKHDEGREYFIGNCVTMMDDIHHITHAQNMTLSSPILLYLEYLRRSVSNTTIDSYGAYLKHSNITDLIITNTVTFAGYMKLRDEPFHQPLRCSTTSSNAINAQLTYLINSYKTQIRSDEPKREFDDGAIIADIIKTRFRADTIPYQLEYDEYIVKVLPDIASAPSSNEPVTDKIVLAKLASNPQTFTDCYKYDKLLLHPQQLLTVSVRLNLTIFNELMYSYFTCPDDIAAFYKLCHHVFVAPIVSEPITLNDRLYPTKPYIYDESYYEHIDYCLTDWIYNCMNMLYPNTGAAPVVYSRDYLEGMPTPRMIIIEAPDTKINSEVVRFIGQGIKHIVVRRKLAQDSSILYDTAGKQYNAPKATTNYRAANLYHYLTNNRARIEAYLYIYNGASNNLQDVLMHFQSNGIAALFSFSKYFYNEMLAYAMK